MGKAFTRLAPKRLQQIVGQDYHELNSGFRVHRSTIDTIFTLRQLQEKHWEPRQPLHVAFINLTKALDLVSRKDVFKFLEKMVCPQKLLNVIIIVISWGHDEHCF